MVRSGGSIYLPRNGFISHSTLPPGPFAIQVNEASKPSKRHKQRCATSREGAKTPHGPALSPVIRSSSARGARPAQDPGGMRVTRQRAEQSSAQQKEAACLCKQVRSPPLVFTAVRDERMADLVLQNNSTVDQEVRGGGRSQGQTAQCGTSGELGTSRQTKLNPD